MARKPRLTVAGQPHLVLQRGGDQPVFHDDTDRALYLDALREVAGSSAVAVHAYALLDNSVLLLASPRDAADLGKLMQRVNRRYVPAFHRRHGGSGALWAGRFQAAAIDPERYLLRCILLIEQSAVRAGVARHPTEWAWSSARHRTGRGASPVITEHAAWWQTGNTPFEREAKHDTALQQMLPDDEVAELLGAARGGWPVGSAKFLETAAQGSELPVQARPRGRPRRASSPR